MPADKRADELLPHTSMFPLLAFGTTLVPQEPAEVFASGGQAAMPILHGNTHDEHVEFVLAAYPEGITAGDTYAYVFSDPSVPTPCPYTCDPRLRMEP